MPATVTLPNNWVPRSYQMPAWKAWEGGIRRELLCWHRRAGKDDLALHKAAVAAHERIANYWHCLPMYEQARKAIWEAVNPHSGKRRIDEAFPLSLRRRTDNGSMTIEFKSGSLWRVVGSDNPDSLVGAPPAGIVFSEWALANPTAWAYLAPILSENNGWASFITTPRGRNHVHSMLEMARKSPDWFAQVLTIADTGYPLERVEEQRNEYHGIFGRDAGDALIEQEYWCSFEAAILGAYYGREMADLEKKGRITKVAIDPDLPVHTAWDLGNEHNMAIWCFQVVLDEIRVVDFLSEYGYFLDKYCAELDARGYHGDDWLPHDARVKSMETGRSRLETLIKYGRKPKLIPSHHVSDGINAGRLTLAHAWFDAERCAYGLEALRQYQAEWDDLRKCFRDTPRHDWTSHPADAWRGLAMAWREMKPAPPPKKDKGPMTINQVTIEDMWKLAEADRPRDWI
jgi:phage terminase large subunit